MEEKVRNYRWILHNSTGDLGYKSAIPVLTNSELVLCLKEEVRSSGLSQLKREAKKRGIDFEQAISISSSLYEKINNLKVQIEEKRLEKQEFLKQNASTSYKKKSALVEEQFMEPIRILEIEIQKLRNEIVLQPTIWDKELIN